MKKTRKINLPDFIKFQTVIGCIIGLILGILYSFGGLIIDMLVSLDWITHPETPGLSYGTLLAFMALVGMPLIFALLGFIVGIVEAILFNICSKWLDWVEINFDQGMNAS